MSNNVYLNIDEINALISGLHNLIEQEEHQHCSADSANDLIEKLSEIATVEHENDKTDAHARLNAAAPELLHALETISGMSSVLPDDKYFREFAVGMCQEAIKKATGEQK